MPNKCCPNCFGDRGLEKHLFQFLATELAKGDCNYCGDPSDKLVEPSELSDVFELLVESYEEAEGGVSLVANFKKDWGLFSHAKMDEAHAKELLSDILDDGEIVRKSFRPLTAPDDSKVGDWLELRQELRFKNRYFLDEKIKEERLKLLLEFLLSAPLEKIWFRARISPDNQPFDAQSMGAPPKGSASHGRANPAGIPYLYLASDENTAISEIRPHTGEFATVAEFELREGLTIVDLRSPKTLVSPFICGSSDEIVQLRADLPFLESLGHELTRPVLPRSAATDYVPSQYLCEFIKKKGFDGVLYTSSVGTGKNLALFDTEAANCIRVSVFSVASVAVTAHEFRTQVRPLERVEN